MRVLGINAVFHDPAAALVVDGQVVAAAEEERFSRRKHGKRPVPFSAWELPEQAAAWCLEQAGLHPGDLDAVAYSFDPGLCRDAAELGLDDPWDHLRVDYARRAPQFLAAALPGLDPEQVRFVPHHVAHAASAGLAVPPDGHDGDSAVLVLDGRGEVASHLGGVYRDGELTTLAGQRLPHSLGLLYEDLTRHLGFLHSSDEYKVMALASYGTPRFLPLLRELVHANDDGGFTVERIDWAALAKARPADAEMTDAHADLASSVQVRLEEVLLDLARWLHDAAGGPRTLTMAGGTALNCVANARIAAEGPYERVWVQPAAGDSGTALGAALHVARSGGPVAPMTRADLGRGWSDEELEAELRRAGLPWTRPASIAAEAARVLAGNGIVAWYQGRSEYGPRALGHRSLLAHPGDPDTTARMNDVKGREQFRPIAPMVRAERFADIFSGVYPSPYMLFVHRVLPEWRDRIPAVTHVDGTARVQTVHPETQPLVSEMLAEFERLTGLPVVVNTSLNTAGRPMVDTPREAMELFGSAPVDLLALGPFAVHRGRAFGDAADGHGGPPVTPGGISVVVPTLGRPSLTALLAALTTGPPPSVPVEILVVDDRRDRRTSPPLPADAGPGDLKVLTGRSAGPAAARNTGWQAARHEWVAFLDDDVLPGPGWLAALVDDLAAAGPRHGGVQGRLRVPLPLGRRPTDWERVTAGLADGEWITADMAYRREALRRSGGFDERLPRAFREDAELAYRVRRAGWELSHGARVVTHPVRPESAWVSVRTQAGNADDALLRHLYGPRWRSVLRVPPGRRRRHVAVTAAGLMALGCATVALTAGRPARGWWGCAAAGAALWSAGTAEFAAARIVGGPGDPQEVATMLVTSVAIPPVAVAHWLRGWWRWRGAAPLGARR